MTGGVADAYRNSRFAGSHVHLVRFLGLFATLTVTIAAEVVLVAIIGSGGSFGPTIGTGGLFDNWVIPAIAMGMVLSWLPAAALTVLWSWRET